MATQWLRRASLWAACAATAFLAACGSSTIESQLAPTRIVVFGDAMADLGQNGRRYTVNDGNVNNWTDVVALNYQVALAPTSQNGMSYAIGNARVSAKPDAAGNAATPTVTQQIDTFLASHTFAEHDLVIVSAGSSDLAVQVQAMLAGAQSRDELMNNLSQAGKDLGAQVRRLVDAGALHVLVMGVYNFGRSPWAVQTQQHQLMQDASTRFNDAFLVSVVDLGRNVLYADAALELNLVTSSPAAFDFGNVMDIACTSVDAGPGIGTGAGQVNSNLCTPSTVKTDIPYDRYLFADRLYLTPHGHRVLGDYAYSRIRSRW
jgi:outer membrane lipase/esterase